MADSIALGLRLGTATEHANFAGIEGEITINETDHRAVVHDGVTKGGYPMAKKSEVDSVAQTASAAQATANAALPLKGGTMTGAITLNTSTLVNRSGDASNLQINGGSSWGKGASIELYGKDRTTDAGAFKVRATDGTNTADFMVMPDSTVKIKGYLLEYVVSQGSSCIRYSSGLQICYLGFSIPDGASSVVVTYPFAFLSVPVVSIGSAGSGSAFVRYGDTTATSVTMIRAGANNNSGTFSGNCVVVGKWK